MTKQISTETETLRIQSGKQSMFDAGPATEISFSDYVPIIGGQATELSIADALAFGGRVKVDGDLLKWDDAGEFDSLEAGKVVSVLVVWDVIDDATGARVFQGSAEIEARGTVSGPVFVNVNTGETSTDGMTFLGFEGQDMLQDAHDFDPVKIVDLSFDSDDFLDVDLEAAVADLKDMGTLAADAANALRLKGEAELTAFGVSGAEAIADAFNKAELEKNLASAAIAGKQLAFDLADAALDAAEGAAKLATEAAAGILDGVADAVDFFTDVGNSIVRLFTGEPSLEEVRIQLLVPALLANTDASVKQALFEAGEISAEELFAARQVALVNQSLLDGIDAAIAAQNGNGNALRNLADRVEDARLDLNEARKALVEAEDRATNAIVDVASKVEELRKNFQVSTIEDFKAFAKSKQAAADRAEAQVFNDLEALQDRGLLEGVTSGAVDVLGTLANIAVGGLKAADEATFNVLDQVDVNADVEVEVDAFAQAGLIVDFKLDGGSVTSDLDYDLTSTATYDTEADTFTIDAIAQSATTGETVAFETVSPNMSFYAGIAYHAGATFDFLIDLFAEVGGVTFLDTGPITHTQDVFFDGVVNLIDFDSKEFEFESNFPGFFGDILSIEASFPTLETKGRAAEFSADTYTDPTSFIDIDALADVILDLVNLRLDFSPEMKALLAKSDLSTETGGDLGEALGAALSNILQILDGSGDTDGDGFVPVFQVQTGEKGTDGLIHLDTIKPDLSGVDLSDGGKFGFFVSEGASDNFFQVNLDVDQLIATAVNVALGNTPESTINPFDLGIGISDILETFKASDEIIELVESFVTLDLSVEAADLDVRAGANFNQSFALSVDDIDFEVIFEDGTTQAFSAADGGKIVIDNASETLRDVNGNGEIEYTLQMTPDATLFNDTELGLNVGYTMDFIKASLESAAHLPLDQLLPGFGLDALTALSSDISLGPILRLDGDLDLVTADVFESLFDFDTGSGRLTASAKFDTDADAGVVPAPEAPVGDIRGGAKGESLTGTKADDAIFGRGGDDQIAAGAGRDKVIGGKGDDFVFGGKGDDVLKGGKGDDVLQGEAGSDQLKGGRDDDVLSGGSGRDILIGGKGDDFLQGDAGADVFKFARNGGNDNIADFETGIDVIAIGKGANGLEDLEIVQNGGSAEIAFAGTFISLDGVLVADLLEAESFSF